MNYPQQLRTAVVGLLAFAASEEEVLLANSQEEEPGTADKWAARPIVAHNTEFKRQQVQRLEAVRNGETPPLFSEIDHTSGTVYASYCARGIEAVRETCHLVARSLIEEMMLTSDDDLLDPSRNSWLSGRQLWLQVVVRGFWHPAGHLGEYYIAHGRAGSALDMQERALRLAELLAVPDLARAMACYNLACANARAGMEADALSILDMAIRLNPELRANAVRDADFAALRSQGRLGGVLGAS